MFPTLRGYRREWLRADLLAGLAAGAVVIPQAMAYATVAGMPVQVGLYTCLVPVVVYAALGGSAALSFTTTSTIATLTASTLLAAGVAAGSVRDLATLTALVGAILLVARTLRLGALVDNISGAVLTGIKTGVALVVAAGQLPDLLGIEAKPGVHGFVRDLWSDLSRLDDANGATVLLAAGSITLLLLGARFAPRVPGQLVVVAVALVLVRVAHLPAHGVALIAPVPRGLPVPDLPPLRHVTGMVPGAFAIALMALLETVAVARGIRRPDEPEPEPDRELTAAGAATLAGAFFGAMPAAGGFSQSAVNQRAGARSQGAGLVLAGLAVLVALLLAGVLSKLPRAVLAAMVIVAVLGLIRPAELARLYRISRIEFWLAVLVAVVGVSAGLLTAVLVGVVGTLFLVLRELDRTGVTVLTPDAAGRFRPDGTGSTPGMLVLRLDGPLYTANLRSARRAILAAVERAQPRPEVVVLDTTAQQLVSVTALDGLRELDRHLAAGGTALWISGLPPRALATARRTRWWPGWEAAGRVYPTNEDAAAHR